MIGLIVRRAATTGATIVAVAALVFLLAQLGPGDATGDASPDDRWTPDQREALRALYHLDRPPLERFGLWVGDVVRGDLGRSFRDRRPVVEKVGEAARVSVLLNALALAATVLLAVPLGVLAASRPGSWVDRAALVGTIAMYSVPVFWAALAVQGLFAVRLGWLPLFGLASDGARDAGLPARALDVARHLVLPVACLTYGGLASLSRFVRANLVESRAADVARAARARGLSSRAVLWTHGFRLAAVPMLTLLGFLIPRLVGGSILVETVFGIRGVGTLFVEAALSRDLPVVLGVTLLAGVATQVGILAADAACAAIDPRIRRAP